MATLNVGPGQTYTTLAAAVAASKDGDVITLKPGTYTDDFATVSTKITIKGDGGMADFVAATQPSNGKGILVTRGDVTVENLSFAGCKVADNNGAGIRYEGGNLTVQNCYFHDNQNGLLANATPDGTITITGSEFKHNGAGDGYSHNLYVNAIAALDIGDSFFHDAVVGHQIKSRAQATTIVNSRVYDDTGNASYSIDLPNGGVGSISDCVIQQSAGSQNSVIIHYGGEGTPYPGSSLDIADCTVVNDKTTGSVFLLSNATTVTANLLATDVWGLTQAQIASGPVHETGTTILASRPKLDSSSPWGDGGTVDPGPEPEPEPEPLPEGVLGYPEFKKANDPGDVGRFNIQVASAQTGRFVSWGHVFAKGKVAGTDLLWTSIGDSPVQMDPKTTHADGTVCHAVLTCRAPKTDAATVKKGKLVLTTTPAEPNVDFAAKLKKNYDVTVELSGGLSATIDLKAELLAVPGDWWLEGPLAVQARVEVPIKGSLRLVADVTAYENGTFLTDIQFRNDEAMPNVGSKFSYTATIIDDGTAVYQSPPLTHHILKNWRWVFHSDSALPTTDTHNVQHHIGDMAKAGAILNYDMTSGIDSAWLRSVETTNIEPFSSQDIQKYFPMTGGRDDIGLTPGWVGRWLKSQDITAARQSLANAAASGSVPWNCWDAARGDYITLDDYPTLWIDGRDPVWAPRFDPAIYDDTWWLDTAHPPALSFIPYLLTGERYLLDLLNAQATGVIFMNWNYMRQDGKGLAFDNAFQVRGQAWMFRSMQEAAYINPDAAPAKAYWQKIVNNNYDQLLSEWIPLWDGQWQDIAGFVMGELPSSGEYTIAPWQEDFVMSVIGVAAERGDAKAKQVADWMTNWCLGRFTHKADGCGWALAFDYYSKVGAGSGSFYTTWPEYGSNNIQGDTMLDGNYVPLGMQSLAIVCNLTGDPAALQAYNDVMATGNPNIAVPSYRTEYPHFHVVPKKGG